MPAGGVGKHLASRSSLGHLCPERRCQFSLFPGIQMEAATFHLFPPPVLVLAGDNYAPPPPRQCFVASVLEGWGTRNELVLGKFKASCHRLLHEGFLKQVL